MKKTTKRWAAAILGAVILWMLPAAALARQEAPLQQAWLADFLAHMEERGHSPETPDPSIATNLMDLENYPHAVATGFGPVYALLSTNEEQETLWYQQFLALSEVADGDFETAYTTFRDAMECAALAAVPEIGDTVSAFSHTLCDDFAAAFAGQEQHLMVVGAKGLDLWILIDPETQVMLFTINPEE